MMANVTVFSLVFIGSVLISSISQLLLKKSADKVYPSRLKEYWNFPVMLAYFLFLLSTLLTVYAYRYVPLSLGPILESTGYVFVCLLSYLFLREKITLKKAIGIAVIILGIFIFTI